MAGVEDVTQQTLDHAKHCFNLPSLAIATIVEVPFHRTAVWGLRQAFWCSTDFLRDGGANLPFDSCPMMVLLAIVSCVGNNMFDRDIGDSLSMMVFKCVQSRPGPRIGWTDMSGL